MAKQNKYTNVQDANIKLFFAPPFWYGLYYLQANPVWGYMQDNIASFLIFVVAARLTYDGFISLLSDFRLRRDWTDAQLPSYSVENDNGGWCTFEQLYAAGCYDGIGRILGTDMEGRLICMPHKLRPTHSWIEFPQGQGKTSCLVISSVLLTPISPAK